MYATIESPRGGPQDATHPLDKANWLQQLAMTWLSPLMKQGTTQSLDLQDVWPLPAGDTSMHLYEAFKKNFKEDATIRTPSISSTSMPTPTLSSAMVKTLRRQLHWATFLFFVSGVLALFQPIVIKSLLQCLGDTPPTTTTLGITSGYGLAGLLAGLTFVSVTLGDYAQYVSTRMGLNAKTIVIQAVFRKLLSMSAVSLRHISSGELVTMVSVDSERVFAGFMFGLWTCVSPFMIVSVYVLLGTELGWLPSLVGGLLMAVFLFAGYHLGQKVGGIRRRMLAIQSERVKLTNEMLHGIRVVKLYAWEDHLQERLADLRAQELVVLKSYQTYRMFNTVSLSIAPVVSLAAALLVYVAQKNALTTPVAFAALAYINIARQPTIVFASSVMSLTEALASLQRVDKFLRTPGTVQLALEQAPTPNASLDAPLVRISRGSFVWAEDKNKGCEDEEEFASFRLQDINLQLYPGNLTIVVGAVGSGKSSLLLAILGEMPQSSGVREVHYCAAFSYASQEPWLQHATVKENILFGAHFDNEHYCRVLRACQLETDLQMLPDGDSTEVGERGINLSGGQKARLGLARAMYYEHAPVYVLDDPLSALDVHVASAVFSQGIQGLLKGKTIVLVLNSHYHFLPSADRVLVMDNSKIVGDGTFSELKHQFPHIADFEARTVDNAEQDPTTDSASTIVPTAGSSTSPSSKLVQAEQKEQGSVTWTTYKTYLGSSGLNGVVVAASIFIFFAVAQTALSMTDWFMGFWTNRPSDNMSMGWASGYLALAIVAAALVCGRSLYVLFVALACSRALHRRILSAVVDAAVPTFFDVTPVGRILNRFSSDLDQIDTTLPYFGLMFLQFLFQIVAVMLVCLVTTPWVGLVYLPLAWVFYKLQQYYNTTSGQLKRMESVAKSPLVSLVTETVQGLSTIRAFALVPQFESRGQTIVDNAMRVSFAYNCGGRWFQLRLDWVASAILTAVAFIAVWTRSSVGMAAAGLSLTYASQLSFFLSKLAVFVTTVENTMTCVERLAQYDTLCAEDAALCHSDLATSWPHKGTICFKSYSMRYREHLDLVLNNVSFTVNGGEKVGICGRTGSGKSSLMAALFRMVPSATGSITLDGVDIASISVRTLRSRLTIIPQDPVLFSGSLRFNLDPANACTDEELWTALKQVHLAEFVGSLEFAISEKGSNVSVGQRQLLCIARALLRKSKVVVLDEATANIDLETDRLIQQMIKEGFEGVTRLIIAHRLETILDSDRILVLDAGQVKEFDAPSTLLANKESAFAQLAAQAHVQL